jgi:endonuclease/exonuclease/phosphatase family metal-dependent hydrolase
MAPMQTTTRAGRVSPLDLESHPAAGWLPFFVTGAVGIWLGVHALRSYFTMVVWNVAEDAPATQMGLVALAVWVVGLLAAAAGRALGAPRAMWVFGSLAAALSLARQTLPGELSSPVLAFATAVVWLAWMPAFLSELSRRALTSVAAAAVIAGLTAQVAGQTALNGLDVHVLTGLRGAIAGAVLAAAFAASLLWARRSPVAVSDSHAEPVWGAAVLWPYLLVQLTLLCNLGRLQVTAGWELLPVAAVTVVGLLAGLAVLHFSVDLRVAVALAAVAVLLLAPGEWMVGRLILAVIPIQVGMSLALAAAFASRSGHVRVHAGYVGGAVVFFILFFLYYSGRDALTLLWPVAAALIAVPLLRTGPSLAIDARRPLAAAGMLALVGIVLSLLPSGANQGRSTAAAPSQLKLLDYNIHQALDYYSVPSAHTLADFIQSTEADVVTLQEVNRGWNISGGVDMVAWLRWRFPSYYVVYGPMQTALFGNVVMSKYPIAQSGWDRYPRGTSTNTRGYTWATVPSAAGEVLLVTTHMTPYAGFDEDRAQQAVALQQFWSSRPRSILAGDYNSTPDDAAMAQLQRSGLKDVHATLGQPTVPTYSSGQPSQRIDYILVSPDVVPQAADVPHSLASDHLPVTATLRLGP